MAWQFIATDLLGVPLGELTQASERRVALPWMRTPTASCQIPLWHPLASSMLNTDCLLKCYRTDPRTSTKTLAFHGPIVSAEETGSADGQSIAVTAAGPYWRLNKRLIPGSLLRSGIAYGTTASPMDLGTMAHLILTDVNGVHFSGIIPGTQANSTNGVVGPWWQKPVDTGIAELTQGLNSFEFRINPTEATAFANPQNWPRIATMDVGPKSTFAVTRNDAIFEYGTTRANIAAYTRSVSRDGLLTKAWISVQGWPDGTLLDIRSSSDSTAINNRGLFEEVVNDAGVTDDGLRDLIAQQHVAVRKDPRQIITFVPTVNAKPSPFIDYNIGELVRARAVVRGITRFDAFFRIWGLTFSIDNMGNESVELELTIP